MAAPESNALPYSVDPITECVLRKGRLQDVEIAISAAGDTTYEGQPFSRAFPTDSTYAEHASWYATSTLADVDGQPYLKYGQPRVLASTDVVPYVPVSGVMSFREPGSRIFHPLVIYVPVRPGCIFEPYIWFGPK